MWSQGLCAIPRLIHPGWSYCSPIAAAAAAGSSFPVVDVSLVPLVPFALIFVRHGSISINI